VPTDIKSLTRAELEIQFTEWHQPMYRLTQLLEWLYTRRVTSWDAMANLPKTLREKLAGKFSLQTLELVRKQGSHGATQKFLWRLDDNQFIESVLIPANSASRDDGSDASDRHTLCISTQVGCVYGCKFCASGLDGWKRNLEPNEIVEQVLAVERLSPQSAIPSRELGGGAHSRLKTVDSRLVDNLVVMGMGEPLANYDNLLKALRILNAPWGGGIGARKITISTCGLAPQIRKLAAEPEQFRLAVSLHGVTDEVRNKIMPVNRKYPLKELVATCEHYQGRKGRMISFEYILIAGVNDSIEQARLLATLARKLFAKVNLIPCNKVEGLPWKRPSEEIQGKFLATLKKQKVATTLRREKGHDIDAACGQLRLKTEKEFGGASSMNP
jgi:23S rRNA (adenine2503-C2)-methyltransferase